MIKPIRTDPFIFRWYLDEARYEWLKGNSDLRLAARDVSESRIRSYELPDGLFLEFAKLELSQSAILDFANHYGDLFETHEVDLVPEGFRMGTPLKRWKIEIGDLHALVHIWEAITDHNIKELETIITWGANGGVRYGIKTPKCHHQAWLAHPNFPETRRNHFKPGAVLLPARYALQAEINKRIADPTTLSVPCLAWTPDHHQRLIFTSSNLLAAMWLQFAQAVTGEYQLKRCEGCGQYFQAGPGGRRADAVTCSDACRQRKRRHSKPEPE